MTTTLYDIDTKQLIGGMRDGPYLVDGKPAVLPPNIVELTVVVPPTPSYDPITQYLQFSDYQADLVNKLWTQSITVLDKTQAQIEQEQLEQQQLIKENTFQEQIRFGYTIPNTSIRLKMDDSARQAWSQLLVLINESIALGQMTESSPVTILDINNAPYTYTVAELKPILTGLGMYYYQLWTERNTVVL